MKTRTRKFTSLFLALILVATMFSSAFAAAYVCPSCHNNITNEFGYCSTCNSYVAPNYNYNYNYGYCTVCSSLTDSTGYCSYCKAYTGYYPGYNYGYCTVCKSPTDSTGYCSYCKAYTGNYPGYNYGYCTVCSSLTDSTGYCSYCKAYTGNYPGYNYGYCTVCNSLTDSTGYCSYCKAYTGYYPGYNYGYCTVCKSPTDSTGYCSYCKAYTGYYPGYNYGYCTVCKSPMDSTGYCSYCKAYTGYYPGYNYGYCTVCKSLTDVNGYCSYCKAYTGYYPGYNYGYCTVCKSPTDSTGYCSYCKAYTGNYPGYNYGYCTVCNSLTDSTGYCSYCKAYTGYYPGYNYGYCTVCKSPTDSTGYCSYCKAYTGYYPGYNYGYCTVCNSLTDSTGYCSYCKAYTGYYPGYNYGYCTVCKSPTDSTGYCSYCKAYTGYYPGYNYGYCTVCKSLTDVNGYCSYCKAYTGYYPGYGYCQNCSYPVTNSSGYCSNCGYSNHYGTTGSGSPITYTAALGESVYINSTDFHTFWSNYTNGAGSLKSVTINSVSGLSGTMCYDHSSSESSHKNALNSTFYVSPTSTQKVLSDFTFIPNKSIGSYPSGSVTISFTANGTTYNTNYTSVKGTITISFTKTDVSSIAYDSFSNIVSLNSADFDSVYRAATGSSSSNVTYSVKFVDLPKYGTLYHDYSANILLPGIGGTQLTPSNISKLSFTNRTTGTYTLNNVTYVSMDGSCREDSARYAVYSGNTLLYVGTITFSPKEVVINYGCTSSGVNFSVNDFLSADSTMYSQYIVFGQPSSGTLYKDYANKQTVTSNDHFSYTAYTGNSLDDVVYVPASGYTGIVEFPFYGSNTNGTAVSGTIRIYVVAKAFEDVNSSSWSATYINRLYASGIIGGTSATTFSPKAEMNYGAALKMILLAAGYPKQSETGGTHWASNYLDLAYRNGIVSSTNIDLNASVDRNTIAEIAAKALGMKPATYINAGVVAPSDSTNGYVYALYNAGIVGGAYADGKNYYNGNEYISREEIAKIVCNIMDYDK